MEKVPELGGKNSLMQLSELIFRSSLALVDKPGCPTIIASFGKGTMFIDLIQLEKQEKDELDFEHIYPASQLDLEDKEVQLCAPCQVQIHLTRREKDIDARGTVNTAVTATCDRCLKAITVEIDSSFNLIFLPLKNLSATDELVLERQELDFSFYQDHRIELDDLVREQIQLALPMTHLCRTDCQGLCRECGQDLNNGKCDCHTESIDPRWNTLLELKKKMK